MNKDEVRAHLSSVGLTKNYKAKWDPEDGRGVILFNTRGKFDINNGKLNGTRVILSSGLITVWTSKVKKARAFCKSLGIRLRELTGECEFSVPVSSGDGVLPAWGAKIKRIMTDAQKARLATTIQKASIYRKKPTGSEGTA